MGLGGRPSSLDWAYNNDHFRACESSIYAKQCDVNARTIGSHPRVPRNIRIHQRIERTICLTWFQGGKQLCFTDRRDPGATLRFLSRSRLPSPGIPTLSRDRDGSGTVMTGPPPISRSERLGARIGPRRAVSVRCSRIGYGHSSSGSYHSH